MTSQELAEINPMQQMLSDVRSAEFRAQIQVALPENVTVERFMRVTSTAILEKPELVNADRKTLLTAVIKCATAGLIPDGKQAALVAFGKDVQFMPMVGGFRAIAAEYGWTLRAKEVYANDEFDYTDEPPVIRHRQAISEQRGELVAAYAVATHRDGRRLQVVMHPDEVAKRKAVARTKQVWEKWPGQMWAKTAARDLFDELPLDPADKRIASVLDASQVEPREAERLLYGRTRPTLPPVSSAAALNESTPAPAESQQAGEEAVEAKAATFPAPGDDEPEPTFDDGSDTEAFTAAAMTAVPAEVSSQNAGRTLAEIADKGPDGAKFLWWALRQAKVTGDFRTALEVFVREAGVAHPVEGELWQRYSRWLNERQAA